MFTIQTIETLDVLSPMAIILTFLSNIPYHCRNVYIFFSNILKGFSSRHLPNIREESENDWFEKDRNCQQLVLVPCGTYGNKRNSALALSRKNVLDTARLGRIIHNRRVERQELKCGNIKQDLEEKAWHLIEMGLLASRYVTLFAESISQASFYTEDMNVD